MGLKELKFKEDVYNLKELWNLHNSGKNLFSEGVVEDIQTGEEFDIVKLEEYKARFAGETYVALKELADPTSLKRKLKAESDRRRKKELERLFEDNSISPDELRQLIALKYDKSEINNCMSYEHFAFLNLAIETPDLTDNELGKFYKMLTKMTKKANSLLRTKNTKSNPVGVSELIDLLGVNERNVYKFLNRLKKENIVRDFKIGNKKYLCINPKYAINGTMTSTTYYIYKDDMEDLFPNIPKEVVKLWEFEFIASTIQY